MMKTRLLVVSLATLFVCVGCSDTKQQWSADHVTTVSGFTVPECTLYDPASGLVYVANMDCNIGEYWIDDGKGHLSILGKDHAITTARWVDSKPASPIHEPKGMCLLGDHLYFNDNTRLLRCSLSGENVEVVASDFKKANDLATDGENVWLSDTEAGKVFCISPSGDTREIMAPAAVNGITFSGDKMFGVSWDLHEIYELDPSGEKAPVAFGLAEHFTNLDGIEVVEDGTFIVSDFMGNKICAVSPDRTRVTTLAELTTPADIGLNRTDGLLYVPQLTQDKVAVYRITQTP
ncbi:MAG: SMP-30/gluconolactonase/LRE family protein [Planctomycetes bacterium]|nr:SMP-30/gluconolactonase/LRE family protein [Planctomycetota bacterium]